MRLKDRQEDEEMQGLTEESHKNDRVLRELGWLKEPEEREVGAGSDEDMPAGDAGAQPSRGQPALRGASAVASEIAEAATVHGGRGPANHASATKMGKGDVDLEMQDFSNEQMQPLRVDDSSPGKEWRDKVAEMRREEVPDWKKKRLYDVWPSRNKFFFRGICMTGGETELGITPNCSVPNLCVWTCILAPCTLYFVWVFPHLWHQGIYAMPAATVAVFFMTSGFLLATCCSDPGIIPRREVILATNTAARLEAALGYDALASGHVPLDGRGGARNLPVELTSRGYRWCRTCRIIRPPRASHCPDCDNCVLRYDHHCPFVNNCVGQRNYHFFFGFVTSVLCLAVMVLPVLFWFLNSDNFEVAVDAMLHVSSGVLQPVFYALIGLGTLIGIAVLLAGILWVYHLFLVATRRTTKEFRRNIENIAEEPTLCATRGPRLFEPWTLVDPRDLIRPDEAPPPPPGNFCSVCWDPDD